jgi:hypothetical protein
MIFTVRASNPFDKRNTRRPRVGTPLTQKQVQLPCSKCAAFLKMWSLGCSRGSVDDWGSTSEVKLSPAPLNVLGSRRGSEAPGLAYMGSELSQ